MSDVSLTAAEIVAKNHVLRMVKKGLQTPVASELDKDDDLQVPEWYNEKLYKRGQKYFFDNLYGQTVALVLGLFCILSEPRDLKLLDKTGRSSDKKAARKRYMETVGHILCWLRYELKPETRAWKSLKKVRNIHANASKFGVSNGLGGISQLEMTMVSFNFLGYQLTRPKELGISCDNPLDRDGYVHFWEVIFHMLGIHDDFNICLYPTNVVEVICEISLRYVFVPLLQLETERYEKMSNAIMDGIGYYIPNSSCESLLFIAKRLSLIPGYQMSNNDQLYTTFPKHYFTPEEYDILRNAMHDDPHYSYMKGLILSPKVFAIDINNGSFSKIIKTTLNDYENELNTEAIMNVLEKSDPATILMAEVHITNFKQYYNNTKYSNLSKVDQLLVKKYTKFTKIMSYSVTKFFVKLLAIVFLAYMFRKTTKKSKKIQ